jgi:hypothetical protein
MSVYKRGGTYWYKFRFDGQVIRESANTDSKRIATEAERVSPPGARAWCQWACEARTPAISCCSTRLAGDQRSADAARFKILPPVHNEADEILEIG